MNFFIEKMGMRVCPTLISFIIMLIFIAPFATGIVNLGNCAGAAISAIFTVIFAFYGKFTEFISCLWKKPIGKIIISGTSVIAIICIAAALLISVLMVRTAMDNPKGQKTTLVVLGCQVKEGRPSLMLRRRLDAAYDYMIEYSDVTAIVSGGKGYDEQISEAQCMKEYLVSKGITPERIIIEDKSSTTSENLKFSSEIIKEKSLNEKITIVSDGYHQLRAEMIANDLGIEAYNISAPTSVWLIPTYVVREWFGVAYQFVFG